MSLSISAIREALEGAIPSSIATCAPDGTPNVSFVSQVHYVDPQHVALSFQFFSKTRENVLANPHASVLVVHPCTAAQYRLHLQYLRTETDGPLFESMKAKLAGIASHEGMAGVFHLKGSDVYRVLDVERVPGGEVPAPQAERNHLAGVRAVSQRIAVVTDLASMLDELLAGLETSFAISHAMVLMHDVSARKLYTVASRGYDDSGVGSEIGFGQGVIGVAAQQRTPIRITHMTADYSYGRAVRESVARGELASALDVEIPFPGLAESRSQLAVPIVLGTNLFGVLFVESPDDGRFGYDDEDALVALAQQLALAAVHLHTIGEERDDAPPPDARRMPVAGTPARIRHFAVNDSVFIDEDYLIKGVAGAILWKLVRDFVDRARTEFSNRELRLDPSIRLPELSENLEARLVLLQRRLAERCSFIRLEKTGRGRFRLCVTRPLELVAA